MLRQLGTFVFSLLLSKHDYLDTTAGRCKHWWEQSAVAVNSRPVSSGGDLVMSFLISRSLLMKTPGGVDGHWTDHVLNDFEDIWIKR